MYIGIGGDMHYCNVHRWRALNRLSIYEKSVAYLDTMWYVVGSMSNPIFKCRNTHKKCFYLTCMNFLFSITIRWCVWYILFINLCINYERVLKKFNATLEWRYLRSFQQLYRIHKCFFNIFHDSSTGTIRSFWKLFNNIKKQLEKCRRFSCTIQ